MDMQSLRKEVAGMEIKGEGRKIESLGGEIFNGDSVGETMSQVVDRRSVGGKSKSVMEKVRNKLSDKKDEMKVDNTGLGTHMSAPMANQKIVNAAH